MSVRLCSEPISFDRPDVMAVNRSDQWLHGDSLFTWRKTPFLFIRERFRVAENSRSARCSLSLFSKMVAARKTNLITAHTPKCLGLVVTSYGSVSSRIATCLGCNKIFANQLPKTFRYSSYSAIKLFSCLFVFFPCVECLPPLDSRCSEFWKIRYAFDLFKSYF